MSFKTISDVRAANKAAGHHFFDRDTMRFFRSRVVSGLYAGRYFITREIFGERPTFTVREVSPSGKVESAHGTVLDDRRSTLEQARELARELASAARANSWATGEVRK